MRLSSGAAALVAGTVAALAPPVLVLGLDQPIGLGLAAGFGLGGALFGLLGLGRRAAAGADLPAARASTARALLAEGEAALEQLRRAGRAIRDPMMREQVRMLGDQALRVIHAAREDPAIAMQVRRRFTFYLPNAASVADGFKALETQSEPEPELAAQTRETMASLNLAFAKFADEMHEPKMQTLDLDLKVLENALRQDLEEPR